MSTRSRLFRFQQNAEHVMTMASFGISTSEIVEILKEHKINLTVEQIETFIEIYTELSAHAIRTPSL